MELAGSVLTLGAAASATSSLSAAGYVVGGGAEVVGGVAHAKASDCAANAQDAAADIEQSKNQMDRMDRLVTSILDGMKADDKSSKNTIDSLESAMQTKNETTVAAAPVSLKG
jgi:hypothetical protein